VEYTNRMLLPLRDFAGTTRKARALADSYVAQELHSEKPSKPDHAVKLLTCIREVLSSIPGWTADYPVRFPRLSPFPPGQCRIVL
jgi:hypothetical protein